METETGFPFEKALAKDGLSFICEVKKHPLKRDHCAGVSVSGHCEGIRSSRSRCHLLSDGTEILSGL